jgi:flagellar hook-associated protein 1 FlgK
VTAAADGLRDSVAGVNLDEEMANMLAYQRAYEGAARVLSAIDSVLDTLINRMGR